MAYVFKEGELPSLIDAKQARERIFFVNQELAHIDDMLAGVMHYKKGAASPLHLHKNCEHFYFIISGNATVESDEGIRPVGPGDMIFIPAEEKHRLRATEPLFYFEFSSPKSLQDHDPRRHRRRLALGAQGRPRLGSDLSPAPVRRKKSCRSHSSIPITFRKRL